jgi:hypothetical protein
MFNNSSSLAAAFSVTNFVTIFAINLLTVDCFAYLDLHIKQSFVAGPHVQLKLELSISLQCD